MLKNYFSVRKSAKCNFKSKHMKNVLSNEMNSFCNAEDRFSWANHENARPTDAQKLLSQWEKVAKCNFKSKAQVHEKCFFLMKWTVFCNAEDRFSWVWAFLQKKSFWSLNAQNHFFRASKNTNSVFSATKQIMRMRGHRCSKTFSVRKSC